ncbi:MAG: LysM peptidoglycan-binding domain-containing protein [Desulfosudaceae bacterium]
MMGNFENSRLFIGALIVCNIILLVLVLFLAGSGGSGFSDKDLNNIQSRLEALEKRLATVDFDPEQIAEMVKQSEAMSGSALVPRERIQDLMARVEALEEDMPSGKRQATVTTSEPEVETGPVTEEARESEPVATKKPSATKSESDSGKTPESSTASSPESSPEPFADNMPAAYYTVKEGDTLYSISLKHGLEPEELRRLNGLESNTIQVDQKLRIQ